MNRGNFLGQQNRDFPVDCETFDFIQSNQELLAVLGQIGGDKAILSGCVKTGSTVAPGYVFLKTTQYPEGEVLKFDGGTIDSVNTTVYISETATSVTAQGYTYPQAYYTRSLKAGLGTEQYLWSDFTRVETNASLKARVKTLEDEVLLLAPLPIGIPQPWTGYISKIPSSMVLYDGRALNIVDYPEAYNVWGTMYNTQNGKTTPAGQFRIPDLSGLFLVDYSATDDDFSDIGKKGGVKDVLLTGRQSGVQAHDHNLPGFSLSDIDGSGGQHGAEHTPGNEIRTGLCAEKSALDTHENLPPYFTVAYIGRIN